MGWIGGERPTLSADSLGIQLNRVRKETEERPRLTRYYKQDFEGNKRIKKAAGKTKKNGKRERHKNTM